MEKNIDKKEWNKVLKNGKTYGENYKELQKLDRLADEAFSKNDMKEWARLCSERKKLNKVFGPTSRPVKRKKPEDRYKIAQITKRKCGDKQQPELQVGRRYFIVGRDTTPTGIEVVLLANLKAYKKNDDVVPAIRCNAKRFEWKEMTQTEAAIEEMTYYKPVIDNMVADIVKNGVPEPPEEKLKKAVQHDVSLFMKELSVKEQLRVSFIPLVIYELTWDYAIEARYCAVRDKVSLLKKQSRYVKEAYNDYLAEIRKDLDYEHFQHVLDQADRCKESMKTDLAILYYSVNNEFKRCVPDYPYDEMRSKAIISQLFFSFAVKWNRDIDEFLADKFPDEKFAPTVLPPHFKKLYPIMESIAGVDGKFNYIDNNIVTSMCVIENRIKQFEFRMLDEKD